MTQGSMATTTSTTLTVSLGNGSTSAEEASTKSTRRSAEHRPMEYKTDSAPSRHRYPPDPHRVASSEVVVAALCCLLGVRSAVPVEDLICLDGFRAAATDPHGSWRMAAPLPASTSKRSSHSTWCSASMVIRKPSVIQAAAGHCL
ncbi:uncharacterized protein LOC120713666 isoform X4 [Panicum virgatum]|uniref:uncharacterized protein LOC120713666 isoform X4 n=1 Tax=Panicum virgatum TaxID=38727 RepID=UPI0019D58284|nr:uncharacterized protein LOC120713666 isoform X4 [Panicum virgatum]